MYKHKTISVCMPCRNEGAHLAQVLQSVPDIVDEVIVVSNRSTDDTLRIGRAWGATMLEDDRVHAGIGYGFAHMTALEAAHGDFIVGMDADGTYPLSYLKAILDRAIADNLDFVTCSRMKHSKMPFKLRLGVELLNIEARVLYGYVFSDILSGMWVLRGDIRSQLRLTEGGWNLSPQIKVNAATNPVIAYGEFPIVQDRRFGTTHQKYFKSGFSHAKWLLDNRLRQNAQQFTAWRSLADQENDASD